MGDKRLVPELRFSEFEKPFKLYSLGDLTKINQGLQIAISNRLSEPIEGAYFYITNEFLREGNKKKYYILNPTKSVLCNKEDVLMTRTGNTGQVVTGVEGAFHNNFFKIKYDSKLLDKTFLVYFLKLNKTQNQILRYAGTSTIPDLNHGDFYRLKINLPKAEEQQKIANFLTSVDQRIQLLEKKKRKLEAYKKGVMQQIFSQEVRFKIENEVGELVEPPDWEEKKLGEIGSTFNGLTGKTKEDFGTGKPYVQYMQIFSNSRINPKEFGLVSIDKSEDQNRVKYGDVFFTTSSETPKEIGTASVILDEIDEVYLNSFCFGYRPKSAAVLSPEFARYLFRSNQFRQRIIPLAQGSTRFNMSKVQLMKLKVMLPTQKEQQKIATFLSSIDNNIEQITQQIEKSKSFKKGLLQKMFV